MFSLIAAKFKIFCALVSGFHRALLESITFFSGLMHSIIQNLEVKIYVVLKFKRHKIKNHSTYFGSYVIHHQGV